MRNRRAERNTVRHNKSRKEKGDKTKCNRVAMGQGGVRYNVVEMGICMRCKETGAHSPKGRGDQTNGKRLAFFPTTFLIMTRMAMAHTPSPIIKTYVGNSPNVGSCHSSSSDAGSIVV